MVALLRNIALRVSVLSKNDMVFWGMPDLVLSVGSVVNKLCDVGWLWPESQLLHLSKGVVSPSPDPVVRFQSWHVWGTWSHLNLWLVELAIAKNSGCLECVCVCVHVRALLLRKNYPDVAHELPGGTWRVQSNTEKLSFGLGQTWIPLWVPPYTSFVLSLIKLCGLSASVSLPDTQR